MTQIKIPCSKCDGSGKEELHEHLTRTLKLFAGGRKLSAMECRDELKETDLTPSAFNRRLEDLRDLGFLSRERPGKAHVYAATKKGQRVIDSLATTDSPST